MEWCFLIKRGIISFLMKARTKSDRLCVVNEVKMKCIEHELMDEIGTKVLFRILDEYVEKGTPCCGKELGILKRSQRPRKYVINLFNDQSKIDKVVISIDETFAPFIRIQREDEMIDSDEDDDIPLLDAMES